MGEFWSIYLPFFSEDFDIKQFETKLKEMYTSYMKPIFGPLNIDIAYILEPITRIHLYSTNPGEPEPTGSITYVYIFGVVAIFLILIAAMNYMNLATARSARRAREVGLRKVSGSRRGPLVIQFLSESTVFTIISLVISVALLIILLYSA